MRAMTRAVHALSVIAMGGLIAAGCGAQVVVSSPSSIDYKVGSAAAHDFYVDGAKKVDISSSGIVVPEE